MSVVKGPEAAVAAVVATLSAHAQAALDAIWTAWGDGATIPEVAPRSVYKFRRDLVPEYPAWVVTWLGSQQVNNGATVWGEVDHRLDVSALVRSDALSVLETQATRHGWAIWEILMANQQLDGSLSGVSGVDPLRAGRSEVYSDKSRTTLIQAVGWEIVVHVMESV